MISVLALLVVFVSFGFAKEKKENRTTFYYSNLGAKTLSDSQVVCVEDGSGNYLLPHLKYLFTYDEQQRLTKKEAFRWDESTKGWMPSFCLTFVYEFDSMIAEYAKWDTHAQSYNPCLERAVYAMSNDVYVSYHYYKRDSQEMEWYLENSCLVDIPTGTYWNEDGVLITEHRK